jgi:hypothetical protein
MRIRTPYYSLAYRYLVENKRKSRSQWSSFIKNWPKKTNVRGMRLPAAISLWCSYQSIHPAARDGAFEFVRLSSELDRYQTKMPSGLRPEGICARDEIRTVSDPQYPRSTARRLLAGLFVTRDRDG